MQRMTAVKVRIRDVNSGEWIKNEGMVPSYIVTPYGEQVSRMRILGTVVSKFISEDSSFASVTVDDGTDTIRLKTFKTTKPIDELGIGDIIDAIGKAREYNGEMYMILETVRKADITWEMLRKLEIMERVSKFGIKEKKKEETPQLKSELLKIISSHKEGIEYTKLAVQAKAGDSEIEEVITNLLAEGICYEARPGIIRKI